MSDPTSELSASDDLPLTIIQAMDDPVGPLQTARYNVLEFAKAHLRRLAKGRQLRPVRIGKSLASARFVAVLVVKNEAVRFPFLLKYYRGLGVQHFIVIDNDSTDGLVDLLMDQSDITLYRASGSYGDARYGNDWVNWVLARHAVGKWVLYVDADEFLVIGAGDGSLSDVTKKLAQAGARSLQTVMLDMYSDRATDENRIDAGIDPLSVCALYDREGYVSRFEHISNTNWIKGGVRGRLFFSDDPLSGPALNKTPLVHWRRGYAYLKSSHQLWPRKLNGGTQPPRGAILHFKFTVESVSKAVDTSVTGQHTAEYEAYQGIREASFVSDRSVRYAGPNDVVDSGLIQPL